MKNILKIDGANVAVTKVAKRATSNNVGSAFAVAQLSRQHTSFGNPTGRWRTFITAITVLLLTIAPKITFAQVGQPYDGVDFSSMIGNYAYYGRFQHMTNPGPVYPGWTYYAPVMMQDPWGNYVWRSPDAQYEADRTPILWQIMGEERGDGFIGMYSRYAIDTKYRHNTATGTYPNSYRFSWLRSWLNAKSTFQNHSQSGFYEQAFSAGEKTAMPPMQIRTTTYNPGYAGIPAVSSETHPENDYVWLPVAIYTVLGNFARWTTWDNGDILTAGAPIPLTEPLLKNGTSVANSWSRSPIYDSDNQNHAGYHYGLDVNAYYNVGSVFSIRPVFKLNPKKVIIAYEVGGTSGPTIPAVSGYYATGTGGTKNYRLVIENLLSTLNFSTTPPASAPTGTNISVTVAGRASGRDLAYKVVGIINNKRTIVNSGRITTNTFTISLNNYSGENLITGEYTVYVWEETGHSQNFAILGSTPISFNLSAMGNPVITTNTLAGGAVGTRYLQTINLQHPKPTTWTVVSGTTPPGFAWQTQSNPTNGIIDFIPTATGSYTFTVRATDAYGFVEKTFTIDIATTVNIFTIGGINVTTGAPVPTTITPTAQYTGTISWSPEHTTFQDGTFYTATITLTPLTGYTFVGVGSNVFSITGATSVRNSENSNIVTATFSTLVVDITGKTISAIRSEISSALSPSYAAVTIIGELNYSGSEYIYISIGSGKKVIWAAKIISTNSATDIVQVSNSGTFELVDGGEIISRNDALTINAQNATAQVIISGGRLETTATMSGPLALALGTFENNPMSVTIAGGEIIGGQNTGVIGASSTVYLRINLTMTGGLIRGFSGTFPAITLVTGHVNISGGIVRANNASAIRYSSSYSGAYSSVTITGGVVFARSDRILGNVSNYGVFVMSGAPLNIHEDSGAAIAWSQTTGTPTYYESKETSILKSPEGITAYWANQEGVSGIFYSSVDGSNSGFLPIDQATVIPVVISIDTQPEPVINFHEGFIMGNLTIDATVNSGDEPQYQWYSNSENSNIGGNLIEGATSNTFEIATTLAIGTHYYYCEVSADGTTPVVSNVAQLNVEPVSACYPISFNVVNGNGTLEALINGVPITSGTELPQGLNLTFKATPDNDYEVKKWTLNGEKIPNLFQNNFIFNIQEEAVITVEFETLLPITIGTGSFTTLSLPFNFNRRQSWAQCIYYDDEIGLPDGGNIRWIKYFTNFAVAQTREVRIFMANTTEEELTQWLPEEIFIPVFEGTIDFPAGQNEVLITLDDYFVYEGENLVILSNRVYSTLITNNQRFMLSASTMNNRTRYYSVDGGDLGNILVPSNVGTGATSFPNIQLFFGNITTYHTVNFGVLNGNGTLTASVNSIPITTGEEVEEDLDVIFTATPNFGYQIKEWKQNGVIIPNHLENSYTLNNIEEEVTITVEFELIPPEFHIITVITDGNGTAQSDVASAQIGTIITLTAEANSEYQFVEWQVISGGIIINDITANPATFTMPDNPVEVMAIFEPIAIYYTVNFGVVKPNGTLTASVDDYPITTGEDVLEGSNVNFTATPNSNFQVKEWKLNGIVIQNNTTNFYTLSDLSANATVTVEFELIPPEYHTITIITDGNGTAQSNVTSAQIGTIITLTAEANSDYQFVEWQVISGGIIINDITANPATFTMPDNDVEVKATFELIYVPIFYPVNFSVVSGNGTLTASVNGTPINSGDVVIEGSNINFLATPEIDYKVKEWILNGIVIQDNTTNYYTLSDISKNANITVEFEIIPPDNHIITVTTDGNGTASADYDLAPAGTTITLTAVPNSEYDFLEWIVISGSITIDDITSNPVTFVMPDNDVEVMATFEVLPPDNHSIIVTTDGNGTAFANYDLAPAGTTISLTAVPNNEYDFLEWIVISGDITINDITTNPAIFTMPDNAVEVMATFEVLPPDNHSIIVTTDGNGTAFADYELAPAGTTITLTAVPNNNYDFLEWIVISGGVTINDITSNPAIFVMLDNDVEVKALFKTVGIDIDTYGHTYLQIYPNPTSGKFSVVSSEMSVVSIEILDVAGRVVHREPLTVDRATIEIDISHLSNGLYFVKVGNEMVKIVKK